LHRDVEREHVERCIERDITEVIKGHGVSAALTDTRRTPRLAAVTFVKRMRSVFDPFWPITREAAVWFASNAPPLPAVRVIVSAASAPLTIKQSTCRQRARQGARRRAGPRSAGRRCGSRR
jgi:hypothetical protein